MEPRALSQSAKDLGLVLDLHGIGMELPLILLLLRGAEDLYISSGMIVLYEYTCMGIHDHSHDGKTGIFEGLYRAPGRETGGLGKN
jgi:hypothetical protein